MNGTQALEVTKRCIPWGRTGVNCKYKYVTDTPWYFCYYMSLVKHSVVHEPRTSSATQQRCCLFRCRTVCLPLLPLCFSYPGLYIPNREHLLCLECHEGNLSAAALFKQPEAAGSSVVVVLGAPWHAAAWQHPAGVPLLSCVPCVMGEPAGF